MKDVFIVRHGQCTHGAQGIMAGRLDPDLTPEGQQQAHDTAHRLAGLLLGAEVALYSSTKNRAVQTAEAIASVLKVGSIMQFPVLDERHLGRFTGLTVSQALEFIDPRHIIDKVHTKFVHHPSYGCETFEQVETRVSQFALYLRTAAHNDQRRPVVTMHGDSGRSLAAVLTERSTEDMLDFPFHNGDILRVSGNDVERIAA